MIIKVDMGTFLILLFLFIFLTSTIAFFYVKRNELFGIRVSKAFESEEIWHKIHVIAALATIPFDIILLLLLFLDSATLKSILAFLICFIIIIIYNIIPNLATRKYFKAKKLIEEKELKEQIKKESG